MRDIPIYYPKPNLKKCYNGIVEHRVRALIIQNVCDQCSHMSISQKREIEISKHAIVAKMFGIFSIQTGQIYE